MLLDNGHIARIVSGCCRQEDQSRSALAGEADDFGVEFQRFQATDLTSANRDDPHRSANLRSDLLAEPFGYAVANAESRTAEGSGGEILSQVVAVDVVAGSS